MRLRGFLVAEEKRLEVKYFYSDIELFGAFFCIIAAAYLYSSSSVIKRQYTSLAAVELACGIMLFCDAFAWFYRGVPGNAAFVILTIANLLTYLATAVLPLTYCFYVVNSTKGEEDRRLLNVCGCVALIAIALIFVNQFFHNIYYIDPMTNLYVRNDAGFAFISALTIFELVCGIVYLVMYKNNIDKNRYIALLIFIIMPLVAALLQIVYYGHSLTSIACLICALILFAQAIDDNARTIIDQQVLIIQQDNELDKLKTQIALSQIRPQFISDALDRALDLCDSDIQKAQQVISNLSAYIKQDLESIENTAMIPFENELEHTKIFLALEKARVGERFDVDITTEVTDFDMPALTLQPLVEHAITRGIYKLPDGVKGKIFISTERGDGYIKVQVRDNGVGFDSRSFVRDDFNNEKIKDLRNVRERLRIMEDAELHIRSKEGEGTTADIIIPSR